MHIEMSFFRNEFKKVQRHALMTLQEFPPPVIAAPREESLGYGSVKPLCEGDFDKDFEYLEVLKETEEELPKVFDAHLPFGVPNMGPVRNMVALLAHPNFITGEVLYALFFYGYNYITLQWRKYQ